MLLAVYKKTLSCCEHLLNEASSVNAIAMFIVTVSLKFIHK